MDNDYIGIARTKKRMVRPKWTYVVPTVAVDYWCHVMADVPAGMYGRDQTRSELHAALCEHYGLTREQTQDVTDHMDRLDHHEGGGATALHKALQDLWDKYPLANKEVDHAD